jgi:hypothetical protein
MYATTVEQALLAASCTFSSIWQEMHEGSTKHHDGATSRARNTATVATAGIFFVDASGALKTQKLAGQLHPPLDTRELGEIDALFTSGSKNLTVLSSVSCASFRECYIIPRNSCRRRFDFTHTHRTCISALIFCTRYRRTTRGAPLLLVSRGRHDQLVRISVHRTVGVFCCRRTCHAAIQQ